MTRRESSIFPVMCCIRVTAIKNSNGKAINLAANISKIWPKNDKREESILKKLKLFSV